MKEDATRELYLDVIRIVAVFLVIFTHTGDIGSKLYKWGDYGNLRNALYMMADIIRCINVPLFFMVSGALLLGRKESYKALLKNRVLRYGVVLVVMSYFYFAIYYEKCWYDFSLFFKQLCTQYVIGIYWFLYEYIGYLLILPLLRKLVINMEIKDYQYLLIMGILFKGVLEVITGLCWWDSFRIPFRLAVDAIFYPIMGYYFSTVAFVYEDRKTVIKKEIMKGLVASCASVIFTGIIMNLEARKTGEYSETFLSCFNVIPTLYVFIVFKLRCAHWKIPVFIRKIIHFMGENSFGIYLFSIFAQVRMMSVYQWINGKLSAFPLLSCLLYVFVVMVVEAVAVSFLRKIPGIRKFI